MPAESPRRSVFRDVSWRWNDVLIGFAPFLLFRAATVVLGPRSALAAALHQFWMPLTLISQSWMLVIPIVIARARNTRPVRLPGPRAVLVEAIFALLVLPVPFAGLACLAADRGSSVRSDGVAGHALGSDGRILQSDRMGGVYRAGDHAGSRRRGDALSRDACTTHSDKDFTRFWPP